MVFKIAIHKLILCLYKGAQFYFFKFVTAADSGTSSVAGDRD